MRRGRRPGKTRRGGDAETRRHGDRKFFLIPCSPSPRLRVSASLTVAPVPSPQSPVPSPQSPVPSPQSPVSSLQSPTPNPRSRSHVRRYHPHRPRRPHLGPPSMPLLPARALVALRRSDRAVRGVRRARLGSAGTRPHREQGRAAQPHSREAVSRSVDAQRRVKKRGRRSEAGGQGRHVLRRRHWASRLIPSIRERTPHAPNQKTLASDLRPPTSPLIPHP